MKDGRLFDFSNKLKLIRVILSHITMMFAVLILVLFVIDRINNAMEFMTSQISRIMIAILAFFALVTSIVNIIALWDNPDKRRHQRIRGYKE